MKNLIIITILLTFGPFLSAEILPVTNDRALELEKAFNDLLEKHKINTIGVSVIKSGEMVWMSHFGEQSLGVLASKNTLFDVASITKTITTQTVLKLVQNKKIALSDHMSEYWIDTDLVNDKRHNLLTPRMALSHNMGLPNWRFFSSDNKLKFVDDPGSNYRYSGEGMEYLARFVEKKLGVPFEELAKRHVYGPAGINNVSLSVRKENFPNIAMAMDAKGKFYGHYCRPNGWCFKEGDTSVAGSMVITVEDYTKFLIWSMNGSGLSDELNNEINSINVDQKLIKEFDCQLLPSAICPKRQGYGLGWNVTEFDGGSLIGHGGSDWSVVSLAYFYPNNKDGLVIFLNAPNAAAMQGMVEAIKLLDPHSPKLHEYQFRLDRMLKNK